MPDALDFELPLLEIENRIAALQSNADGPRARDEIAKLEDRLARLRQKTYSSLTAWQRTQLARHPKRPHTRDFFKLLFEDFVELHGDRVFGDDAAVVAGLARFEGQGVVVIGHQKGRDTREKIARNLREMAGLRTPILTVVTGEGGSGGALAIGMGNRVLMLEYAIYSVISPEGCAAILWGDASKAPEAAESMRITAPDLLKLGVIDAIVPEPVGGAHRDWEGAAGHLREALRDQLGQLTSKPADSLVAERYEKFRKIGAFEEASTPSAGA